MFHVLSSNPKSQIPNPKLISLLFLSIALLCIGFAVGQRVVVLRLAEHDVRRFLPDHSAQLCEGVVTGRPEVTPARARVRVALRGCRRGETMMSRTGAIDIYADALSSAVRDGAMVRFRCTLRLPQTFRNPGTMISGLRRRNEGVAALCRVADLTWMTVVAPPDPGPRTWGRDWVRTAAATLEATHTPEVAGLLRALILGQGDALVTERWDQFRRVGVIHLLVVSGLHVGAVAIVLFVVIGWLLRRSAWLVLRVPVWRMAAALALLGSWSYVWMTGARLPAVRAAILATALFGALICERRRDLPSALALAFILVLMFQPLALWLPSFQLTFAAVAAIMLWGPWLAGRTHDTPMPGVMQRLRDAIAVTIAATIGVVPIIAYHFHETSLMGMVANILLVPWVSFILVPLGLLFLAVVGWWPGLAALIGVPLGKSAEFLLGAVGWADQWSGGWQVQFTPLGVEVLLWYALFLLIVVARDSWFVTRVVGNGRRWLCLGIGLVLVVSVGVSGCVRMGVFMGRDTLRLTFVDVAQGLAMVLRFPNGTVYVVDGGGVARSNFDMGRWVLAPFLHREQIDQVDALFMTHYHPDHYGGLPYLAEAFGAELLYTNGSGAPETDPLWPAMQERLSAAGTTQKRLTSATPAWQEGEVGIRVLHPGASHEMEGLSENDRSLVLELTYRNHRFLLTGDIEAEAEQRLLKSGELHDVDLVQVPHHGSDTSSTAAWVNVVHPAVAVISCGQHNRYGFPSEQVVANYQEVGAEVYRTDLQGAITVESNGTQLTVTPFVSSRGVRSSKF